MEGWRATYQDVITGCASVLVFVQHKAYIYLCIICKTGLAVTKLLECQIGTSDFFLKGGKEEIQYNTTLYELVTPAPGKICFYYQHMRTNF